MIALMREIPRWWQKLLGGRAERQAAIRLEEIAERIKRIRDEKTLEIFRRAAEVDAGIAELEAGLERLEWDIIAYQRNVQEGAKIVKLYA